MDIEYQGLDVPELPLVRRGPTRDVYATPTGDLLVVVSDRVSTDGVVHHGLVPDRGEVLNILDIYWRAVLWDLPHCLVCWGTHIYDVLPRGVRERYPTLHYRGVVVEQLGMIPVEFKFRRYLTGNLYTAYRRDEDPYGLALAPDLACMARFTEPLLTAKDAVHGGPLLEADLCDAEPDAVRLCRTTFERAERHLLMNGVTVVNTKLVVGRRCDGTLALGGDVLSPDASRFVPTGEIVPGEDPPFLDKQALRDYAHTMWGGGPHVPLNIPQLVLGLTEHTYKQLLRIVTKRTLAEWRVRLDQHVVR